MLTIKLDDLSSPAVIDLLQAHVLDLALHSPPGSTHTLDIQALRDPEISVWSAWEGNELVGCGALKTLDSTHAEIKSMRTAESHQRKGVAKQLLQHILITARQRDYQRLSLETGSMAAFEPARRLYAGFGFGDCDPFGEYTLDPNSVYMTLQL